jgi:hypothetical protein
MENNEIVSRLTPIFRDVFNDDALVQRFQGSNHMMPLCRACRTMSGPLVALGVAHLGHDAMLAVSWNR